MMSIESTEVLVVDDSRADAELTIHALKIGDVTSRVTWLSNAEEALFYMFRARQYANRELATPDLMLLTSTCQASVALVSYSDSSMIRERNTCPS